MRKILYMPGQIKGIQYVLNSYGITESTNFFRHIMLLNYTIYYNKDPDFEEKRRISSSYTSAYPDLDGITNEEGIRMRMQEIIKQCWEANPSYDIYLYITWKKALSHFELINIKDNESVMLFSAIKLKNRDMIFYSKHEIVIQSLSF